MPLQAWATAAVGLLTIVVNLITLAVAYGVLRGTVSGLAARVSAVEVELAAVTDLRVSIAEVKTRVDGLYEQLRDLNASVRWMRSPAGAHERSGGRAGDRP